MAMAALHPASTGDPAWRDAGWREAIGRSPGWRNGGRDHAWRDATGRAPAGPDVRWRDSGRRRATERWS
jgi:hypothetical protein